MPQAAEYPGPDPRSPEFDRFVTETKASLVESLLIRFHCDRRTAEEVALEAIELYWQDSSGFDPLRGTPLAYLRGIACNLMRRRHRTRGRSREVPLDCLVLADPKTPDPAKRHEARSLSETLWREVRRLGPEPEWAITGIYREGKSVGELMKERNRSRRQIDHLVRQSMTRLERRLRRLRASFLALQEPCNFRPETGNSMQA